MSETEFFSEPTPQSVVKAEIVSKYFSAWAGVILPQVKKQPNGRMAFIDLFSGPGRYGDGSKSTPLIVAEKTIADPELRQRLMLMFNDRDPSYVESLRKELKLIVGIDSLRYRPRVRNYEVGTEIAERFNQMRIVPPLLFVDPWGYRGLSLDLLNAVLKDWGCDCVFFFNYNRVNAGLSNPLVKNHMEALFGVDRARQLGSTLTGKDPIDRELTIVEALVEALGGSRGRYVLPFRFRSSENERTSHHLIFVTKSFRGYAIMKDIMAKQSSSHEQGVPSFEYNPAREAQPLLFEFARPIDDLREMLLSEFAGETLTMEEIYKKHSVGRPYIKRNYKQILLQLEKEGIIATDPAPTHRRKGTFADGVKVTFPQH